jgi:hypothetical protein
MPYISKWRSFPPELPYGTLVEIIDDNSLHDKKLIGKQGVIIGKPGFGDYVIQFQPYCGRPNLQITSFCVKEVLLDVIK